MEYSKEYKIKIQNLLGAETKLLVDDKEGYVFPDFLSPRQIEKLKGQGTMSVESWLNGLQIGQFTCSKIEIDNGDMIIHFKRIWNDTHEDRVKYFMASSAAQRTDRQEQRDLRLMAAKILVVNDKKNRIQYNYKNLLTYGFFLLNVVLGLFQFVLAGIKYPLDRYFGDYSMMFEKSEINKQIKDNRLME